mgnify:CR=1 FL=1
MQGRDWWSIPGTSTAANSKFADNMNTLYANRKQVHLLQMCLSVDLQMILSAGEDENDMAVAEIKRVFGHKTPGSAEEGTLSMVYYRIFPSRPASWSFFEYGVLCVVCTRVCVCECVLQLFGLKLCGSSSVKNGAFLGVRCIER